MEQAIREPIATPSRATAPLTAAERELLNRRTSEARELALAEIFIGRVKALRQEMLRERREKRRAA
jgi:hypothetical protein